jgi:transcriptional regulator with PAS, ATPase and Fis domain
MIARLIHQESKRVTEPFVHIDLGSLVESLFESALFGHAKGAFTDAGEDKAGLVEMANLGTLFLDNISELSLNQQAKLLSVIQNREVMRVGEHLPRAVDIRLICTTHLSLDQLSSASYFRQDLFFRINTMVIELPPLRRRMDDIKPLIKYFLDHFNSKYNKAVSLSKTEISTLCNHSWPGNVRELMNTLERVVIMQGEESNSLQIKAFEHSEQSDNLYAIESAKIAELIARHTGNISRAAQELGIGRNTLYRKIKKYDL